MTPAQPLSTEESPLICRSYTRNTSQPTEPHGTPGSDGPYKPTAEALIATEEKIAALWQDGQLPYLTHLDGSADGSLERFLCDFFVKNIKPTDWVLGSHRSHLIYQLHGGTDVVEQVMRGRSMFLHREKFITSAIVAGAASIAAGLALAIQREGRDERVFAFGGDGCQEHGHWLEAVFYSFAKNLPIHWIICDNNSSCGVGKDERRGGSHWGYDALPVNVTVFKYNPKWPHAGTGEPMTLSRTTP